MTLMFLRPFSTLRSTDTCIAGGKGASLGEMTQAGIPVPPGFVVTAQAFEYFLDESGIHESILTELSHVQHENINSIEKASSTIQELILAQKFPEEISSPLTPLLERREEGEMREEEVRFAVRSSATAEDGVEHAWAGQLDTYLNVGKGEVLEKIQHCWASLFTPRAIFYRCEKGLIDTHISVAIVIQEMIPSESAGVAFSVHPVTENPDEIVIEGSYGLGEAIVSGEVTPDSFVVSKKSLASNLLEKGGAEERGGGLSKNNTAYEKDEKYFPYDIELKEYAQEMRKNPSLAEKRMWYDILQYGDLKKYKFLRQKPLLYYIADFYCSELKLVIEVDGDNHEDQKWYDTKRTEQLEKYGITVLRFHNLEVINNPVAVEKIIRDFIHNPPSYGHLPSQGGTGSILSRHIAAKTRGIFTSEKNGNEWREIFEPQSSSPMLTDDQILELAQLIARIENHYGFPCDIEWAFFENNFYILQARPITTLKKTLTFHPFPNGVVKMGRWALPFLSSECWKSEITQKRFFDKLGIWREFIVLHEIDPDFQNPYYSKDFFDVLKIRLDELYSEDNKALFNRAITFYDEEVEAKKSIDKLNDIDLKKQTNEDLTAIFLENRRLTAFMAVYDQMGWLCENYLYAGITNILDKKGLKKNSEEFNRYQFKLTQPQHISTTLKEKKAVLESSQCIRSGKSTLEKEADYLSKVFGYMPVFAYGVAWDSDYYREQLRDILSTDRDVQEEIAQLVSYSSIQKKDFSEAASNLGLNLEEQQKFIDFGLILDVRNEAEYFVSYAGKHFVKILDEVSKRLDIPTNKLLNLMKSEIVLLLTGGDSRENILSRRGKIAGWGYLDGSGLRTVFDGVEAENIFQACENDKIFIQGNTEEKGVCGSPGKAQGRIRIVANPYENSKVQTGDILVTYATTVDYLPAMKKAGAIITEVGGITCHAAVISREFRIPCVIAFKNAMEYFSDGDLVEVDADTGIVKKIPKVEKLATLYETQISLTEWFQNIGHENADILRTEDNEKRERLKVLGKHIGLPFDKPTKFHPRDILEKSPAFLEYMDQHGNEKCALRLIPSESGLPKLRMRGQTISEVVQNWLPQQSIDPDKYRAEFIPHPEKNIWATIFIVNEKGIFGEIIADGHHHLTQGFYEEVKPSTFFYDFKTWKTFPENPEAETYLAEMTQYICIGDPSLQELLRSDLGASFSHNYLMGYFETTHSEFGTWFIDYSPTLGQMYGDFFPAEGGKIGDLQGIAAYPGKITGRARIIDDPSGVQLESDEILVCDMTSPSYVHLMQQAAAIITNRGGVLSHAGIIARELKKPTVLATGNATRVLQNGDLIEVDADNAIIRIL